MLILAQPLAFYAGLLSNMIQLSKAVVVVGFSGLIACDRGAFLSAADGAPPAGKGADRGALTVPLEGQAAHDAASGLVPYAPGRWRLATFEELERVMLWPSHILVRHRDVPEGIVSFNLPVWKAAPPPPHRTRLEALQMAQKIANEASATPAAFAQLARQHSEDIATSAAGGSLGGVDAFRLERWPEVLDAFATMKPGQVSRVVETTYGFHVFTLHPPPNERSVSGERIIIGYDEAPWLHRFLARRAIPERSRAQALALALSVYREARDNPGAFHRLVEQYSDHRDAQRGGDFGAWSTIEQTPFPEAVQALQQLEVGGVAPPIDSLFGFQIIRRTPDRARVSYSMKRIQRTFDPARADGDPGSRVAVRESMAGIARAVQSDPAKFEAAQRQYCCPEITSWVEGQGSAPEESILAGLKVGEITADPIELGNLMLLIQRLPPADANRARVSFELPAPDNPDVAYFVSRFDLSDWLLDVGQAAAESIRLDPSRAMQFRVLHDLTKALGESRSEEERLAIFESSQTQLAGLLSAEEYGRYRALLSERLTKHVLRPTQGVTTVSMQ